MIGALFGIVYVGVPAITNLVLDEPIMILPIPFLDLTDNAHSVLPASLAGLSFDLGIPLFAMVLPFPVVAGMFTSSMLTSVFGNPILYRLGMLPSWKPGMDLLSTKFVTDFDLWMSVGIGTALAVAVLGQPHQPLFDDGRPARQPHQRRGLRTRHRQHPQHGCWRPWYS